MKDNGKDEEFVKTQNYDHQAFADKVASETKSATQMGQAGSSGKSLEGRK